MQQPVTVQLSSLRTNKSLCGPIGLRPLPADYQPVAETLPEVTADESERELASEEVDDMYESADQLGAELVTLSLLPESRWKSLLHLDDIKVPHVRASLTVLSSGSTEPDMVTRINADNYVSYGGLD